MVDLVADRAELVAGDCSLHEAVDWILVKAAEYTATIATVKT